MTILASRSAGLHTLVGRVSAGIAILLAVLPPLIYFATAKLRIVTQTEIEAQVIATAMSNLAARNPGLWPFETLRIADLITRAVPHGDHDCVIRIDDADNLFVMQEGGVAPWPSVSTRLPFYASGIRSGSVEVRHSMLPMLIDAGVIGTLSVLLAVIGHIMLRQLPQRALSRALDSITHLATHDILTDLPNRAVFMDRLGLALAEERREGAGELCVLCLDLDRFKEVNDTLGHATGDALLRHVARQLRQELRDTDTVARLGGDEFAIILPRRNHPHTAEVIAQRLIDLLTAPIDLGPHQVRIGVSIGIALARQRSHETPDALLSDADTALYAAKREGRGVFRFFAEDMNVALRERRALEADLRRALAQGEFSLAYQPQVDIHGGAVIGVEALLRWNHPVRGTVMPDRFIPLAEEIGLLPEIGAWVLREACANAMRWDGIRIAVNVSAHQIHAGGFETLVARALQQSGLPGARLEIEITEGVLLSKTESTIATLEQIRALGVSIAMDDFGTGYSSLGYLQRFRFDKIKIDRSFVSTLGHDPRADAIVDAVLGITRALGVRANAEGVETPEQAEILARRGCDEGQGWLFGRPTSADEIDALIATQRRQVRVA